MRPVNHSWPTSPPLGWEHVNLTGEIPLGDQRAHPDSTLQKEGPAVSCVLPGLAVGCRTAAVTDEARVVAIAVVGPAPGVVSETPVSDRNRNNRL